MVAAADHFTPTAPSGNLAASISKDGAAFVACVNVPVSVGNGLVTVLLTAAETTCDYYCVRFTGDGVDPVMVPMYTESDWTATRAGYLTGAVALEATLTAMKGAGWTDETMVALLAAVESISGAGVNTVAVTLTDDNSDPCAGIWVKAVVGAQSFWAKTNTSGIATFLLDDGTYTFWPASSSLYTWGTGGSGYYTGVVSGDTALAFQATLQTIPASADPDLCTCYLDIRALVGGAAIAEGTGWLQITQQTVPGFPDASSPGQAALARLDTVYTSDASGRITVEIVRGATVSLFAGVGAGPTGANTERRRAVNVVVPDAASYDLTQATWS